MGGNVEVGLCAKEFCIAGRVGGLCESSAHSLQIILFHYASHSDLLVCEFRLLVAIYRKQDVLNCYFRFSRLVD